MARAGDRLYGVLEAIYGFKVTDELLRSRGIAATRSQFLRSQFLESLAVGLALAAAVAASSLLAGIPALASSLLSAAALAEGFLISASAGARRLAGAAPRPAAAAAPRPHLAASAAKRLGPLPALAERIYGRERVRKLVELAAFPHPPDYFYGVAAASIAIAAAAGLAAGAAAAASYRIPLLALAGFLGGAASGALAPFAYLSYRASNRKGLLERDLAQWIAAMMSYVSSGAPLPEAMRKSAAAINPGPLRQELERANRDAEMGSDFRSSLLAMARRSPSLLLSEVVSGLVDALDSGKDLKAFFGEILGYVLSVRRNYMRKLMNDLLFAAELFVMLFVVTPLLLSVMLAIMGSLSVGAQAYYVELLELLAFLFVPAVGVGYMLLVDSIYPRWW